MNQINVGLIGFGIIGTGVVKILQKKAEFIEKKLGFKVSLKTICDLDVETDRGVSTEGIKLTKEVNDIFNDDAIHIVIELMGGYEPARTFILKALEKGKDVVTANKALLAVHGEELFKKAYELDRSIGFEASTGGCIPILRSLRESFTVNSYDYVLGIVNGTCNYILSQMSEKGASFNDALKKAQELGFAEADPTFDLEGVDSAHKASILTTMGYQKFISFESIYKEGIKGITVNDIKYAKELGYNIKLIAFIKEINGRMDVRVHPAMLDENSEIANVSGVLNAVQVEGDMIGFSLMVGEGAGSLPTASAVLGDVLEIAGDYINRKNNEEKCFATPPLGTLAKNIDKGEILPIEEIITEYYLLFQVIDKPNVLSQLTGTLGRNDISISRVVQKERAEGEYVPLIILTHESVEKNVQNAIAEIKKEGYCDGVSLIRVIN
ncbi:MAG: homoserine dehydrogenase [Nitrospinae bacterium]|nr:homoserine dehydrogenase [Nitrospinota bacterium]